MSTRLDDDNSLDETAVSRLGSTPTAAPPPPPGYGGATAEEGRCPRHRVRRVVVALHLLRRCLRAVSHDGDGTGTGSGITVPRFGEFLSFLFLFSSLVVASCITTYKFKSI
jgi:hypothetical protein